MSALSVPALLAAITLPAEADAEGFLLPIVNALRAAGWKVGGMTAPDDELKDLCRRPMHLEDLITGERVKISQDLGPQSNSCSLDPGQLAIAGRFIQRAIDEGVDLVVVNKFGKREAAGAGLREEIIGVLGAGLPLLTTVKPEIVDAWREFVGEYGVLLPADAAGVRAWCTQVRAQIASTHDDPALGR